MIRICIFDADGVIIENKGLFSDYLEKKYSITTSKTYDFFHGVFTDCLIGKADMRKELPSYLSSWGWTKGVDAFINEWFTSEHHINHFLVAIIQNLRKRGVRCYIATNQEKYRTAYLINQMGFEKTFDGVFSSAHLGFKKPHPAFFQSVMDALPGVKRNEIIFFDDTLEHIAQAARFGWQAYLYTSIHDATEKLEILL